MVRKFAAMLVLALVGLGLPAAAAGARSIPPPPPCSGGSVTITTNVRLTANYTCAQVDVLGSPTSVTTINLGGFRLTGTITADSATKVLNGTVAGSFTGVPGGGPPLTLLRVRVTGDVGRAAWARNLTVSYSEVDGAITADGMKNVIDHSLILGGVHIDDVIVGVSLSITNNWITSTGPGITVEDAFLQPDILGTIGGNVVWKAVEQEWPWAWGPTSTASRSATTC